MRTGVVTAHTIPPFKQVEIIAKLDDLDKRAEVVLGIKERRKNRIFQMTDGARILDEDLRDDIIQVTQRWFLKAYDKVPKGIAFFLARGGRDVAIIIETKNSTLINNFGWGTILAQFRLMEKIPRNIQPQIRISEKRKTIL
ncbi:hypothetical protein ACJX0J_016699, partial [Zea mays]